MPNTGLDNLDVHLHLDGHSEMLFSSTATKTSVASIRLFEFYFSHLSKLLSVKRHISIVANWMLKESN